MPSAEARFRAALDARLAWLKQVALPLWAERGVDSAGGFHERIAQDGCPVIDLPRRARVVARQTYVFLVATERGWGDYRAMATHGAAALFDRCLLETGLALSTYAPDGQPLRRDYDAYDQAFVLFALATLARTRPDLRERASAAGERLLAGMQRDYCHPELGFEEAVPRRLPLLQNPHMHLLEACLAFDDVPGASPVWREQARALVSLATSRLSDVDTGAIHEHFDADWRPIVDDGGAIEPGHQFEWAWLLWLWQDRSGDAGAATLAARLYRIGNDHGCNAAGHAIDLLDRHLAPRAVSTRLWPQTERLKACVAAATRADGAARTAALAAATQALESLHPYLDTPLPGLWFDRLTAAGAPIQDAAPASSLYHIVCALDYAERAASSLFTDR